MCITSFSAEFLILLPYSEKTRTCEVVIIIFLSVLNRRRFLLWAPRKVRIPSMPSLGCSFPSSFMSQSRGIMTTLAEASSDVDPHLPRDMSPKAASPPTIIPYSWSQDTHYCWIIKHQTPRKKGIPVPYASTRYPTILELSSIHMTFKLSY